jgi:hypothetical protein
MRGARPLLFAVAMAVAVMAAAAPKDKPDALKAKPVADLHYGDVLFNFYLGEEFAALTRLGAYQHWGRMPTHQYDAELLAGGLYLSLGMHNEAGERFQKLLTPDVPAGVRNRAWFYLAKVWYARGYYPRAEQALNRISGTLAPALESERQHLHVNLLLRMQRYDEAIARVQQFKGTDVWSMYARFNLGVALIRQNRVDDSESVLTAVGTVQSKSSEAQSLADKANLALGYALLAIKQPERARTALNRVRLDGPFASRALLGVGWAYAALDDYNSALTPWLELRDRNLLDAAVQEAWLAVPYAYGKLGASAQAANQYEAAIEAFKTESARLDTAVAHIGAGHLLDEIIGAENDGKLGWFWQLRKLPDSVQSRYLYALLADNDFQEGLKNYRDMSNFGATLKRWDENMDIYGAMIETRQLAYAAQLPATDALLATNAPQGLIGRRAGVDAELTAAETASDAAALGTAAERAQWTKIRALEAPLANEPAGEATEAMRDKLRLIKGVLQWRLDEKFRERDYTLRNTLRDIDAGLNQLQNRWSRVQRARASAPEKTAGFAERINALVARLAQLRADLETMRERQNAFLSQLAQAQLLAQKDRLAAYEVQAQFALADMYDRAASTVTPAANDKAAAPAPAPAAGNGGAP